MKNMENIIETRKGNVYLGCHLKKVVLLLDPCSNFPQTA
jgi:hypothetical protein